jgi:hypothetical protein
VKRLTRAPVPHYITCAMVRKAIDVRIEEGADGRFLVTTYDNGDVTRELLKKRPRKKRTPDKPYWNWRFGRKIDS